MVETRVSKYKEYRKDIENVSSFLKKASKDEEIVKKVEKPKRNRPSISDHKFRSIMIGAGLGLIVACLIILLIVLIVK